MYVARRRRPVPRRAAPARRRNDNDIPEAPKRNEADGKAQDEGREARAEEAGQDNRERIGSFNRRNSLTSNRADSVRSRAVGGDSQRPALPTLSCHNKPN